MTILKGTIFRKSFHSLKGINGSSLLPSLIRLDGYNTEMMVVLLVVEDDNTSSGQWSVVGEHNNYPIIRAF